MAPRLVWIMASGLDPDGIVSRLDTLPSLAVLLEHGSMGFLELSAPAEPDIAQWMMLAERPVETLPWRSGLRLPRPDPLAMRLLARFPGACVVTLGQGDSRLPGHFDVPPGPSAIHEISRIVDCVAQAVQTEPECLVIQLPAAAHALHGISEMAGLFDAAMRAILTVLGPQTHVMVSSALSFRPYQRVVDLVEVLASEHVVGVRAGAEFALVEVDDPSHMATVQERLSRVRTLENVGLIADIAHLEGHPRIVVVRPVAGCGFTVSPDEDESQVMSGYGALIVAGPKAAKGALPSIDVEHLLEGVDNLMHGTPERGPLAPWFRTRDESSVDLSQRLYGARASGENYP